MGTLKEAIAKAETPVLWGIVADISVVLGAYNMSADDSGFMIWYALFAELHNEIDRRLAADF